MEKSVAEFEPRYERYKIFQSIFQISIDVAEREARFRDVGRRFFRYFRALRFR